VGAVPHAAGLAVRMVGENPQAAEGQGVSVAATRTSAIVAGSALMGVAGSFLTLSAFNAFFFNMVNGRGWICVALVVFASWRPGKALLGALLFAFFDALQLRLQQSGNAALPYQLYLMLPYAAVHPRAGAGGPQGRLSAGADETLPQGRALNMLDLLITNATLPDGRQNMAVAVQAGKIVELAEGLSAPAHETLDAGGYLLSPPFVRPALSHGRHAQLRPAACE
jgi:hypothetical protein